MSFEVDIHKSISHLIDKEEWNFDSAVLKNLLRYTVSCDPVPVESDELSLGTSKIGGRPHLPADISWMQANGKSMTFVAQINFEEVKPYDRDGIFPEKGILYFFIEADEENLPFEKLEKSKVLFLENPKNLERKNYPADLTDLTKFSTFDLKFRADYVLPSLFDSRLKALNLTDKDVYHLGLINNHICTVTHRSLTCEDWMLGYPHSLTSDVYEAWARQGGGEASDYEQLLQISFMDYASDLYFFGDTGIAFWGLRREDLKKRSFEKAVLVCQGV
jgi:uncharacterized protein YwqG